MPRNLCMFRGNLTRDPDVRTANGKTVVKFAIAVNGFKEGDVEFIDCEAWEKTAEFVRNNIVKGDQVDVTSRVKTERWDDKKTGEKRQKSIYVVQILDAIKLKKWDGESTTPEDDVEDDPKPARRRKVEDDSDDYDPEEKIRF